MSSSKGRAKTGKASARPRDRSSTTARSTSGAGFDFEDRFGAWLLAKALAGEAIPGFQDATPTKLQFQVAALGVELDDLMLSGATAAGEPRRLMISSKANRQVTGSGFKPDFTAAVWKQRASGGGAFAVGDGFALAKRGATASFDDPWAEIKNALSSNDVDLGLARIQGVGKQRPIFESLRDPSAQQGEGGDEAVADIIRRTTVITVDLQLDGSRDEIHGVGLCKSLVESGQNADAQALWKDLLETARTARLTHGTVTLAELWARLRRERALRHAPDSAAAWRTLMTLSEAAKARVEMALPSGVIVERAALADALAEAVTRSPLTVVHGPSGCGKSALVRATLETVLSEHQMLWLGPDDLAALVDPLARPRLNLTAPLERLLAATGRPQNVLVIDAAERLVGDAYAAVARLFADIFTDCAGTWRVVLVAQSDAWESLARTLAPTSAPAVQEVGDLEPADVRSALRQHPGYEWLSAEPATVAVLGNLRTLGWVLQAPATQVSAGALDSPAAIADRVWQFWTSGNLAAQGLLTRLGVREAEFVRSFPISQFDPTEAETLERWLPRLPLVRDELNRIRFEHDLAADWARFQRLKEIAEDSAALATFAANPLWANALRMLGQARLRAPSREGRASAWDDLYTAFERDKQALAGDLLLDAMGLDPDALTHLEARDDVLLAESGARLNRLLTRFQAIASVPATPAVAVGVGADLSLYFEAYYRIPQVLRWRPIIGFLARHTEVIAEFRSPVVAQLCKTWLQALPRQGAAGETIFGREALARLSLASARALQAEFIYGRHFWGEEVNQVFEAAFAAAADLPEEVAQWALEMAERRPADPGVAEHVALRRRAEADARRAWAEQNPQAHAEALAKRASVGSGSIGISRRRLPPWPLGPRGRVNNRFRNCALHRGVLLPLIQARPEEAAELILALVIEDEPEEEGSRYGMDRSLGLEHDSEAYPTAYWGTPLYGFLQVNPGAALAAITTLVNFVMERWQVAVGRDGWAPSIAIDGPDQQRAYAGNGDVFHWSQADSMFLGNLHAALAALEKWLCDRADLGKDLTPAVSLLLREGRSASFVGVLVNLAKYKPELLTGVLAPLARSADAYSWDNARVEAFHGLDAMAWATKGQLVFDMAQQWLLAPHRKISLLGVVVDRLFEDSSLADMVGEAARGWATPEGQREQLLHRDLVARLDRARYVLVRDASGVERYAYSPPPELVADQRAFQAPNQDRLNDLTLPYQVKDRLKSDAPLTEEEALGCAQELARRLERAEGAALAVEVGAQNEDDEDALEPQRRDLNGVVMAALADVLTLRAHAWLQQNPEAEAHCTTSLRRSVERCGAHAVKSRGALGLRDDELSFAAQAVATRWAEGEAGWDEALLTILTGDDGAAMELIMLTTERRASLLEAAWWRLNQIAVLWAALSSLRPEYGDGPAVRARWLRWLQRLRRSNIHGGVQTIAVIDVARIERGLGRIKRIRQVRAYLDDEQPFARDPEDLRPATIDSRTLGHALVWLWDVARSDSTERRALVLRLWQAEASMVYRRSGGGDEEEDEDNKVDRLDSYGYSLVERLAQIAATGSDAEARAVFDALLPLGTRAKMALSRFIGVWFGHGADAQRAPRFTARWRAMVEAMLVEGWGGQRRLYEAQSLLRQALGFGMPASVTALAEHDRTLKGMADVYRAWAERFLPADRDNIDGFANFIAGKAGAPLRLDGVIWITSALEGETADRLWGRRDSFNALVELVNIVLSEDRAAVATRPEVRTALLALTAMLVTRQAAMALALQERLKSMH